MKNHTQTIINVCFAIFITVYIYQDNKQEARIDTLEKELAVHIVKRHPFIIPPPPGETTLSSCLAALEDSSMEGIDDCWNKHKDK